MNLNSKLYIIKHSSSFTYSDFTPDFTWLFALHNILAAEQLHSLLIERSFLGHLFVVNTHGFTAYGTASKVFGLELEILLSDCEKHRLKRFLLKCLLVVRRRDETTCR